MRISLIAALAVTLLAARAGLAQEIQPYPYTLIPAKVVPKKSFELMYGYSEGLTWWIQSSPTPPLVTVAQPGTDPAIAGILGTPGTSILFGGERENGEARTGARYTAGLFVVPGLVAVEGSFFILESQSHGIAVSSGGEPILARPFFNVLANQSDAELISVPGLQSGSVQAEVTSNNLIGAGALVRVGLGGCPGRFDFLAGYRFLRFDEGVRVREDLTTLTDDFFVPAGTRVMFQDSFLTSNQFHGADVGVETTLRGGPFTFNLLAKCGIGNTYRRTRISGLSSFTLPGQPAEVSDIGGLAQPSNIGTYTSNAFTLLPEFGARFGFLLTPNCELTAGYTFIWWPEVLRPGDQVDLRVNVNQFPGQPGAPPLPAFPNKDSSLWIQGISLGMAFRF